MSPSRIMAIDPGERRIGVAISDETHLIARPLVILEHSRLEDDAARIAALAKEHGASLVLVGVALDSQGEIGVQARRGWKLVEALRAHRGLRVEPRDESFSTVEAATARRAQGGRRVKHDLLDAAAAAVILQEYLDTLGHAE